MFPGRKKLRIGKENTKHLGKSGLHHECFPENLRTASFWNISEQLSHLFSQTIFHMLLQDNTSFLKCFSSFLRVYFSLHLCIKTKFNFWITLTLGIQETYSECQSQRSTMELFAKIVNSFPWITIFTKSSILDVSYNKKFHII